MYSIEIGLGVLWIVLDSSITWVPVRWANLPVLFRKLEGINQTEGFIYRASNWEVIDSDLIVSLARLQADVSTGWINT